MKNIFEATVTQEVIERIEKLAPESKSLWGKWRPDKCLHMLVLHMI